MCDNPENEGELGFSFEKTVKSIGNPDIAFRAVRMFITTGKGDYLTPLKKSIEKKDIKSIFNTSHKLYGIAARLKITGIAKPAKRIVEASRNNKETDYKKHYSEIIKLFKVLKRNFHI